MTHCLRVLLWQSLLICTMPEAQMEVVVRQTILLWRLNTHIFTDTMKSKITWKRVCKYKYGQINHHGVSPLLLLSYKGALVLNALQRTGIY
jgi:hypothetical protein